MPVSKGTGRHVAARSAIRTTGDSPAMPQNRPDRAPIVAERQGCSRRTFLERLGLTAAFVRWGPLLAAPTDPPLSGYQFSGPISRAILENYLSHSLSMRGFWVWARTPADSGTVAQYADSLRMLK